LAVVAAGVGMLATGMFWGVPVSKSICGALRVLDGEVPYRDFWSMYAPGQFYAVAALFAMFGRHVLIQAAAVVLIRALTGGVLYRICRRLGADRPVAAGLALLFVGSLVKPAPELTTYPPALLCLLIAVERIVCYLRDDRRVSLPWIGVWLGIAACFKHDVAAYAAVSISLTFFVTWYGLGGRRSAAWLHPVKASAKLAAGALAVFLPAASLIAWSAGPDVWQRLVVFPATDFRAVRDEPYQPLLPSWQPIADWAEDWRDVYKARAVIAGQAGWLMCNVPQWVFVIAAGWLAVRRRQIDAKTIATAAFFLICLPPFWLAAHIQQNTHIYSMAVFSLLLAGMAQIRLATVARSRRRLRGLLVAGVGVYACGLLAQPAMGLFRTVVQWPESRRLDLPGTAGIRVPQDDHEVYDNITRFIRTHVPPTERIYVGVKRHDAIVINNLRFYYLSGRRNCCRYDELHPGVTDRDDVQREIIDALETHAVRCVVLWRFGWSEATLNEIKARNQDALPGLGSTRLDTYLAARFETIAQYGEYDLMWRKDLPPPVTDRVTGR
jgi:hypothetical protein